VEAQAQAQVEAQAQAQVEAQAQAQVEAQAQAQVEAQAQKGALTLCDLSIPLRSRRNGHTPGTAALSDHFPSVSLTYRGVNLIGLYARLFLH